MEPVEEGCYYHIYNRGAGRAPIFFSESDYSFFMKKFFFYLYIPVETFAWCLLKNHFHLLVRIRTIEEQNAIFKTVKKRYPEGSFFGDDYKQPKPFLSSQQLAHLFNSYTKYINKKKNRSGTLIEGTFKRKKILDENHFLNIACYIHRNPIHHGISKSYPDYPHSSFLEIIENKNPLIESEKLLNRFGGKTNYLNAHIEFQLKLGEDLYLE